MPKGTSCNVYVTLYDCDFDFLFMTLLSEGIKVCSYYKMRTKEKTQVSFQHKWLSIINVT